MMTFQSDLYQEIILDHNKHPRNFGKLDAADHVADGYNPLCGDKVTVFLKMNGDVIEQIGFSGAGCAISTASASLMTESLKGKKRAEVEETFTVFHNLVTGQDKTGAGKPGMEKLAAFAGVSEYPARVKCATLVWHTLLAALNGQQMAVSTE